MQSTVIMTQQPSPLEWAMQQDIASMRADQKDMLTEHQRSSELLSEIKGALSTR